MPVDDEIREIEKGVYLVHGKVIKEVFSGQYDSDEGRRELVRLADGSCGARYAPKCYGDLTVFSFSSLGKKDGRMRYRGSTQRHFMELSDTAKAILREEFPEHAREF